VVISIPGDTPEQKKCVMPGDNLVLEMELKKPVVSKKKEVADE